MIDDEFVAYVVALVMCRSYSITLMLIIEEMEKFFKSMSYGALNL